MRTALLIALAISSFAYMASARTFEQISNAAGPMTMFLTLTILGFFCFRWVMFGLPRISIQLIFLPIYVFILSAIEAIIFYSAWAVIADAYLGIRSLSPPRPLYVALVALLLLSVSAALFFFRLKARFFFGLSEALVGFVIGIWKTPEVADPTTWNLDVIFVMVTASIFLIVRGFDNMYAGLSSSPDALLDFFHRSEYGRFLSESKDQNKIG